MSFRKQWTYMAADDKSCIVRNYEETNRQHIIYIYICIFLVRSCLDFGGSVWSEKDSQRTLKHEFGSCNSDAHMVCALVWSSFGLIWVWFGSA